MIGRYRVVVLAGVAVGVSALALAVGFSQPGGGAEHKVRIPTMTRRGGGEVPGREKVVLGRSVRGRPIVALLLGDLDAARPLLVVGAIHGDEPAGIAIARDLGSDPPPRSGLIVTIPDLNPDGVAAGTRQNARGVDLNRNFPWHWRHLERLGDPQYSGPHPLSEPESRIAHSLILRRRPRITIWFHQPLGLVDESGGNRRVEALLARHMRLPLRRLTRYPGSAASWQDHRLPGTTAMVVELPPGKPSPRFVERGSDAIRTLLARYA
ncbi:MAG TPA: M14 family zinc carboxypeptidase [Solirubrobacterales bacterium]|jgi:protein MpaA